MHIYIHVPFCARRCSYCDFAIAVRRVTPDDAFVAAIVAEWHAWLAGQDAEPDAAIDTLYFGGGTPSRLQPSSIARLVDTLAADRVLAAGAEVTLETNPDDVTAERAAAWRQAGVNRVSLGVQSHADAVLAWMHRTHRSAQVPAAFATLREAGISNISADLIFALPADLGRDWQADLTRTLELEPAHLSLYGLTFEPHTPLFRWRERGTAIAPPDERYAEEFLAAHDRLTAAGLAYYELSNAARPGFASRHNAAYWSGGDYLGLGPSAHSFERGVRRWNVRDWAAYQSRRATGRSTVDGTEVLDERARTLEQRYLALRTTAGIGIAELPAATGATWVREGWAVTVGDRIRLTPEGWLRLDALVGAAPDS